MNIMSKETFVFVGGIFLTIVPFLGIPEMWRLGIVVGMGVLFILVGYALRRSVYLSRIDRGNGERGTDSFVETTKPLFEDRTLQ